MAHECPGCYCVCHCNGDIDDLVLNYERDIARCIHCDEAGEMEEIYDEDEEEAESSQANEVSAAEPPKDPTVTPTLPQARSGDGIEGGRGAGSEGVIRG